MNGGWRIFTKEINFKHSLKAQFNRAQINNSKKSIYPANSDWILEALFENCLEKHLLYLLTHYECFPILFIFLKLNIIQQKCLGLSER